MTNQNSNTTNGKRTLFQRFRDRAKGVKEYKTSGKDDIEEDGYNEVEDKRDPLLMLKEGLDFRPYFFTLLENGKLDDNTVTTVKKITKFRAYKDEKGVKTLVKEEEVIPNYNVKIALYDSAGDIINNISSFCEEMKKKGKNYSLTEKISY